jgi:L-fuconolactonase
MPDPGPTSRIFSGAHSQTSRKKQLRLPWGPFAEGDEEVIVVDSHCHALPHWFEPVEVLLHQMNANGVEKATLVQVRGQFDNRYIIECVRRFPARFCALVIVDTDRPDAPDTLAHWVREGAVGVRLGPTVRSPGRDPLAIWRRAEELRIAVSAFGSTEEFISPVFEEVLKEVPTLPIIIEHLGRIGRHKGTPYPTFQKILALAQYPNAYMKVHGLGEICPRPIPFPQPMRFENIPPFIEMAYEAFGASRMMWGSDFPPVAGREGYRNALQWSMDHIPFHNDADKEWIFGKTALSLFKFTSD